MGSATVTEATMEAVVLDWPAELRYQVLRGPETAPGELEAERDNVREALLPKLISGEVRVGEGEAVSVLTP